MAHGSIHDPSVIILASRYDLSCDHVVSRLRDRDVSYLRLNSEDLPDLKLTMDPIRGTIEGNNADGFSFVVRAATARGVYFRRPVFLRSHGTSDDSPEVSLAKEQWHALVRAFMVLDGCKWMNHPGATYVAESKPVQLRAAATVGLAVPKTLVTNSVSGFTPVARNGKLAIKGLDTVLVRDKSTERFGYTIITSPGEVMPEDVASFPVIAQEAFPNKIDLRATIVGEEVFCVSITDDGQPIEGDWRRKKKESLSFRCHCLPDDIRSRCIQLMHRLGLAFGAIDLALVENVHYFLEINPTGEWSWLLRSPGIPIDDSIARYLA